MIFKAIIHFCIAILLVPAAHAEAVAPLAVVAAHNKWRAEAGVQALSHSPKLAKSAQAWANHLKQSQHCTMQHSKPKGSYGENLYWASPLMWSDGRKELRKVSPTEVIDSWANEKDDYDLARNACRTGAICGHYTQIVWRDTAKVGCGMATCSDSREQIWVCHYSPAGNIAGETPY
ncbi:CAP domain-containing protein [Methylotenera sp. G11]|uniref:CAP domain-containing protein n=1 Tax=Methylotenera sp. G11 TaxID=1506585 RepID=UPI00069181AD|nr:CAP domain-containing protein [Methylotenera sp. G11]